MICLATDLAGLSRGPQGVAEVRLLSLVGLRVGEYCGRGPGMRARGTSPLSSRGRGTGGAGRCGWR